MHEIRREKPANLTQRPEDEEYYSTTEKILLTKSFSSPDENGAKALICRDRRALKVEAYKRFFHYYFEDGSSIMQKFVAEKSFWNVLPHAAIGIMVVRDMKTANEVPAEDAAEIARILSEANAAANKHLESNTISENQVVRVWREAYQQFKTKKGARCSIENLLKRVLKGNPVGSITPSVDIYNAISLKYALPVGGEDIDSFVGDVRLGLDSEGGMAFRPLGEDSDDPTLAGEVCYYDDEGAICRCWNWRDGERTALSDDSRNAFLVIECVDPERMNDLNAALDEFAQLMERYLGATICAREIITRENPEMTIAE